MPELPEEITLEFLARQQARILDELATMREDLRLLREDVRVLTAMLIRQSQAVDNLLARYDRLDARLRRLEEEKPA